MQGRGRQNNVRPSVWTKLKEVKEHGEDPWTTQDTERKMERETKIEEQINLIPVRHADRRRTKRESAQTTGCIREDCAARAKERDAGVGAKTEPACTRTKRKTQEPGGTHHRKSKRTENRMDQTEEAIRLTQQMQQRKEMMFQQFLARAQEEAGGKWRMATSWTN